MDNKVAQQVVMLRETLQEGLRGCLQDLGVRSVALQELALVASAKYFNDKITLEKVVLQQTGELELRDPVKLELVDEDTVEQNLGIARIEQLIESANEGVLQQVHAAFNRLLARDAEFEDCPVHPRVVGAAFRALLTSETFSKQEASDLLGQAREQVPKRMGSVYGALLATFDFFRVPAASPATFIYEATMPPGLPPNSVVLDTDGESIDLFRSNDVGAQLLEALIQRRSSTEALEPGTVAYAELVQEVATELEIARQSGSLLSPYEALKPSLPKLPSSMAGLLDTLELLFEGVVTHPMLSQPVQTGVARLRIPFMQLAMEDNFLSRTANPAQRLVDGILTLGMALEPDAPATHPLNQIVTDVTTRVANAPLVTTDFLEKELGRFLNMTRAQREQIQAHLARYLEQIERIEAREEALTRASLVLGGLMTPYTPLEIRALFERYWVFILAQIPAMDNKAALSEWSSLLTLSSQIADAAQPGHSASAYQAAMEAFIPQIEEKLSVLKVNKTEQQQVLRSCAQAFTRLGKQGNQSGTAIQPQPYWPQLTPIQGVEQLTFFGHAGYSEALSPPTYLDVVEIGDWFCLGLPNGTLYRGQVHWIGTERNLLLLGRPQHDEGLVVSVRALAVLEAHGAARLIRPGHLVEEVSQTLLDMLPAA